MRRTIATTTASTISAELAGCEHAGDLGLIALMRLSAAMLEGRIKLGLSASVRSELVQEAGDIIKADFARRERLIRLHARLADTGARLGVDVTSLGDSGFKDENDVAGSSTALIQDGISTEAHPVAA